MRTPFSDHFFDHFFDCKGLLEKYSIDKQKNFLREKSRKIFEYVRITGNFPGSIGKLTKKLMYYIINTDKNIVGSDNIFSQNKQFCETFFPLFNTNICFYHNINKDHEIGIFSVFNSPCFLQLFFIILRFPLQSSPRRSRPSLWRAPLSSAL